MLEHLFGSKTRLKLLKVFFRDPVKSYYVRELTRLLDAQINAVRRELGALLAAGLVREMEGVGKSEVGAGSPRLQAGASLRKYYALNPESILYPELQALLIKAQALGEAQFADEIKAKGGDVRLLLLSGRFTGDRRALTDMLVVGRLNEAAVGRLVKKYEQEFGGDINYTLMTVTEFEDRRQVMDRFLFSLFEAKHLKVVDKLNV